MTRGLYFNETVHKKQSEEIGGFILSLRAKRSNLLCKKASLGNVLSLCL